MARRIPEDEACDNGTCYDRDCTCYQCAICGACMVEPYEGEYPETCADCGGAGSRVIDGGDATDAEDFRDARCEAVLAIAAASGATVIAH